MRTAGCCIRAGNLTPPSSPTLPTTSSPPSTPAFPPAWPRRHRWPPRLRARARTCSSRGTRGRAASGSPRSLRAAPSSVARARACLACSRPRSSTTLCGCGTERPAARSLGGTTARAPSGRASAGTTRCLWALTPSSCARATGAGPLRLRSRLTSTARAALERPRQVPLPALLCLPAFHLPFRALLLSAHLATAVYCLCFQLHLRCCCL